MPNVPMWTLEGVQMVALMLVLFGACVGVIALCIRSNGKDQLRIDQHMQSCHRGENCFHPDHVHPDPEPDFYDELEAVRAPRGFLERMGS